MSQSINSASQIRIILLLVLLFVIYVGVDVANKQARGTVRGPVLDRTLVQVSSEVNKHLPYMVDSETRLEHTAPGPGKTIRIQYTMVNIDKEKCANRTTITRAMRSAMIKRYKSEASLKRFRELGVTLDVKFFDKYGSLLTAFQVGPLDLDERPAAGRPELTSKGSS
jgi:hypothetical protein